MITAVAEAKHFMHVHVFVQILMFLSWNLVTAEQCVIHFICVLCVCVCAVSVFTCCSRFYCTLQPYILDMAVYCAN